MGNRVIDNVGNAQLHIQKAVHRTLFDSVEGVAEKFSITESAATMSMAKALLAEAACILQAGFGDKDETDEESEEGILNLCHRLSETITDFYKLGERYGNQD